MPPAEMAAEKGDKMVGLAAAGWLVMFGRKGEVAGEITYTAPQGKTEHLLVDLKRDAAYTVTGIAGEAKEIITGKEGTLRFTTQKKGTVTLTPVERGGK